MLQQPPEILQYRPAEGKWSILECIEHLNIYSRYYLPEIKNRLEASTPQTNPNFKSGRLGNYFVQLIEPKDNLNKMKTSKTMNPIDQTLDKSNLEEFKEHLLDLLNVLNQARKYDLGKIKTGISLTRWIKLKLGDTLRFVVVHNERHVLQAKRILKQYKEKIST